MSRKAKIDQIIEKLIEEVASSDEEKREKFILDNKRSVIQVNKLLQQSIMKDELSDNEASQTMGLNCLLAISSAATSKAFEIDLINSFLSEEKFINYLINRIHNNKSNDLHLGIIVNLTRCSTGANDIYKLCPKDFFSKLIRKFEDNEMVAAMMTNFTQIGDLREQIVNEKALINQFFQIFKESNNPIMRNAALCIIRNCCFDTHLHEKLFDESLELITKLIYPLAGPEEFDGDDMEKLPIDLQYLGPEKTREKDDEIRKLLIECVFLLCATKYGREKIRNSNIYFILREYHKWENIKANQKTLEDLIDILIRDEPEINTDDFTQVSIPDDLVNKFNELDKELLKED